MTKDDKAIKSLERDRWQDKQVDRRNAIRMIVQKGPPALRRWQPAAAHIPSNRRLSDLEAELEQLTMNAWCAPAFARLISPMSVRSSAETFGLPIRLRDRQRQYTRNPARCHRMMVSGLTIAIAPKDGGKPAIEPNEQKTIGIVQVRPFRRPSSEHIDLLPQDQDFRLQLCSRPEKPRRQESV